MSAVLVHLRRQARDGRIHDGHLLLRIQIDRQGRVTGNVHEQDRGQFALLGCRFECCQLGLK